MKIKYKVQKLFEQKKKVEKAIESLQFKCKHSDQVMKFVYKNHRSSQSTIRWVCEDCEMTLLWPTETEVKNFLQNKR